MVVCEGGVRVGEGDVDLWWWWGVFSVKVFFIKWEYDMTIVEMYPLSKTPVLRDCY